MVDLLLEHSATSASQAQLETYSPTEEPSAIKLRRLALVVEYQGTNYCGFQLQVGHPTIQGELEQALQRLTGQFTRIRGASRTDSGAHARAQVVDFLTNVPFSSEVFLRGLNSYLPSGIKVRGSYETDQNFHSRKSAISRRYRYTFLNSPTPSPLVREFSHWVRDPLDIFAMNEAARALHGVHDFTQLAGALPTDQSAIRHVLRWELWGDGDMVFMDTEANGFLPHQIRRTGAILLAIGLGRLEPQALQSILMGEAPVPAWCAVLPAKGLCLMAVEYNDFPPEK